MKALLATLAVALSLVLLSQWLHWPPAPPGESAEATPPPPPQAPAPPGENPLDRLAPLEDKEEYAMVTERPLFMSDRRPPSEEAQEEETPPAQTPSDLAGLDLNAVVITPSETSAWIRDPSTKKLVRLRPGEELAGWSVLEILSDRILLERQGEKDTLVLRDYKNMPPPSPPQRTPAARKIPRPSTRAQNGQRPDRTEPAANRPSAARRSRAQRVRAPESTMQSNQRR